MMLVLERCCLNWHAWQSIFICASFGRAHVVSCCCLPSFICMYLLNQMHVACLKSFSSMHVRLQLSRTSITHAHAFLNLSVMHIKLDASSACHVLLPFNVHTYPTRRLC